MKNRLQITRRILAVPLAIVLILLFDIVNILNFIMCLIAGESCECTIYTFKCIYKSIKTFIETGAAKLE